MKIEKVRWDVGQGWGCRGGWLGVRGEWKGMKDVKNVFGGMLARSVYVHSFNDIRQGALQSDCV